MYKSHVTKIAFTLFVFIFLLSSNKIDAQNATNYKYIHDDDVSQFRSILEVNNHYYVVSSRYAEFAEDAIYFITIFDEDFNEIEKKQLSINGINLKLTKLFHEQDTFYASGWGYRNNDYRDDWGFFIAKFDKDFNLVDTIFTLWLPYMHYEKMYSTSILKIKNNEFMLCLYSWAYESRLLHIGKNGEILQEVLFDTIWNGSLVETDSNYIFDICSNLIPTSVFVFDKDTLSKYKCVNTMAKRHNYSDALVINNKLLLSGENYSPSSSSGCSLAQVNVVYFLDTDFKIEHTLTFGDYKDCPHSYGGTMDYRNPDSIYSAYGTKYDDTNDDMHFHTIGIACFNSEGILHSDILLENIPNGSMCIAGCKVLSDGGILLSGSAVNGYLGALTYHSFLLYYHPNKEFTNVKPQVSNYKLQIFPNPAQTHFTITNTENADIYLYNIVGQEVLHIYGTEENTVINVNSLTQGVYLLKVVKEGNVSAHKVIKN